MSLNSFVKTSRPLPQPICTSRSIQDRDSTFVANIFRAASPAAANAIVKHVKTVSHAANPASHEMMAYRIMSLKPGHTGLNGPDDFEVKGGTDDDGERYGAARILKIMQKEGVLDAVVILFTEAARYGGTMLGPIRFTHIENCTHDVCVRFKVIEELEGCVERLESLDRTCSELRAKIAAVSLTTAPMNKSHDYSSLLTTPDIARARRLINAREGAVRSLETILKKRSKEPQPQDAGAGGIIL